jgi:hypothetical protein
MDNKYINGKIYIITDIGYNKCYYGSTIQTLSQRMTGHRADYKRYLNGIGCKCASFELFDEFGVENYKIELVELYPCNSKVELEKQEGLYIKNNDCVNKNLAGRNKKEYQLANKDKIKEYYINNKDQKLEYQKEYRLANKDKIKDQKHQSYLRSKAKLLQYYIDNKDQKLEYQKEYRLANKDKIKDQKHQSYLRSKAKLLQKEEKERERLQKE